MRSAPPPEGLPQKVPDMLKAALKTSHFRVAAQFLALFAATGTVVLALVYWQTSGYLLREVDRGLRENVERWSQLGAENLVREITRRTQRDPARRQPAVLFGNGGERLAGGLQMDERSIPSHDRAYDLPLVFPDGHVRPLRAYARVLPSGLVLLVSQDIHELREFNERLRAVMVGGLALFVLIGLAGAAAFGHAAHRRLEHMRRALDMIVTGQLSARLPVHAAGDDLGRIAGMVNTMLDELERLMGEVKGVTDGIAHDLRTPLTRMIATLERTQRHPPDREHLVVTLGHTLEEARTLMQMFNGLLRIAEIEDVLRRDHFVPLDLAEIGRDVVEVFDPVAQDKGIRLTLIHEGPVHWLGDANLLFDALSNLVDNALKFTPDQGHVQLIMDTTGGHLRVAVCDDGPGIPVAEREQVLSRFYRSERSRHTPGHGLGLSLVVAIARLHRLSVRVEDAGPGCVVILASEATSTP